MNVLGALHTYAYRFAGALTGFCCGAALGAIARIFCWARDALVLECRSGVRTVNVAETALASLAWGAQIAKQWVLLAAAEQCRAQCDDKHRQ